MTDAREEIIERMAAAWLASEEGASIAWALKALAAGKDAVHCGDCTKQPMTCMRCFRDEYLKCARAAYAVIEERRDAKKSSSRGCNIAPDLIDGARRPSTSMGNGWRRAMPTIGRYMSPRTGCLSPPLPSKGARHEPAIRTQPHRRDADRKRAAARHSGGEMMIKFKLIFAALLILAARGASADDLSSDYLWAPATDLSLTQPPLDPGGAMNDDFKRGACWAAHVAFPSSRKTTVTFEMAPGFSCAPEPAPRDAPEAK